MKLLIAADIFPPESGGPATYCVTLANELVKRGDEVRIVSLNLDGDHVTHNTYHVSFRNKLLKYLQYTYLLWKHAKDVDVIYAMGPVNAGLPALIVAGLRKKKFVVKVVGDYAWEQWQIFNFSRQSTGPRILSGQFSIFNFVAPEDFLKQKVSLKISILKWVERLVAQKANRVIVPSEYLKKIVVGWGVKQEKIEVIYNAVEFKAVDSIKHDGERWLVSVGRLVPWKGMVALVEIMPDLLRQFPDLRLKVVGYGPELENIKYQISNIKLNDLVELVGELSHDKTISYIKSADLFVLNSGYEGCSHVILEAIKLGTPVLASNCGGNPELTTLNRREFLFKYNNNEEIKEKVVDFLLGKKHVIPVMSSEEKRIFLSQFTLEKMINNTKKALIDVCAS